LTRIYSGCRWRDDVVVGERSGDEREETSERRERDSGTGIETG
jgi:hypothetical protein